MNTLLPALAGAGYVYGCGTIDTGMTFSIPAMLLDAEIAQATLRVLQGITVDVETLAVDVINKVGPNGNFFSNKHTVKHYRNEQSSAVLFDRTTRDIWEANGKKTAYDNAVEMAKDLAENHKPIPLKPEIQKGLKDILDEAVEEKGLTGWDKGREVL